MFPCSSLVVLENKFFTRVLSVSTNGLEVFDVLGCHVGQEAKILLNRLSG